MNAFVSVPLRRHDDDLERQAIYWLVKLQSQPDNFDLQKRCNAWRHERAEHEQAWQAVQQTSGLLRQNIARLPAEDKKPYVHALKYAGTNLERRKNMGRLAAFFLVAAPVGWFTERHLPWERWRADYATETGQQRDIELPDGTLLTLNTDSAVRVRFSELQRTVLLDRGEVFIRAAAGGSSSPQLPLRVLTDQGLMEAPRADFAVRLLPRQASSRLSVQDGTVRMFPGWRDSSITRTATLAQADSTWFITRSGVQRQGLANHGQGLDPFSWTSGIMVVDDMKLTDFLAEVSRYRPGYLGWDDDLVNVRVSGTYRLADTTRLLALLVEALPIEVVTRTALWAYVRRASK